MSNPLEPRRRDLGMDPALLRPPGFMTVYFAHLERELEYLIWSLLASNNIIRGVTEEQGPVVRMEIQVGQAVTASMSCGRKVELLATLVAERFGGREALVAETETLARLLRSLEERRNQIIHSSWVNSGAPGARVRRKVRTRGTRGVVRVFERVTRDQLMDFAGNLADAATKVSLLRDRLYPEDGHEGAEQRDEPDGRRASDGRPQVISVLGGHQREATVE